MAERNALTDAFRLAGLTAVACLHTHPFQRIALGEMIDLLARFAVPMFFILAGYFWARQLEARRDSPLALGAAYVRRLLIIWLFWCAIYALEAPIIADGSQGYFRRAYWAFLQTVTHHWMEGTRFHLWFLVALGLGMLIVALGLQFRMSIRQLLVTGAVIYLFGLLGGGYSMTPMGLQVPFNTRDFFFLSGPFIVIGIAIRGRAQELQNYAWPLAIGGCVLQLAEAVWLKAVFDVPIGHHDYLLGTMPFALGMTLLALGVEYHSSRLVTLCARMGRYSLGIYSVHLIFVDLLEPARERVPYPLWDCLTPVIVVLLSFVMAASMARLPLLRRFVM